MQLMWPQHGPLMSISDADSTSVCLVEGPRTLVVELEYEIGFVSRPALNSLARSQV